MNSGPETIFPSLLADAPQGSAMIAQTFGEPLFHTETDVACLAHAPDGSLWSIEENGVLRQWSVDGHILQRFFLSDLETLWAFSNDAAMVASGSDSIMLWESATGLLLTQIEAPSWVSALAFTRDGRQLASGHENGLVCLWDVDSGEMIAQIAAHPAQVQVSALAFRPDGEVLATAGEDRLIRLWGVPDLSTMQTLTGHTDRVPALAWHPSGSYLVSAGWDTTARLWRPPQLDPIMLLNSHSEQVLTLAFSNAGVLAVADSDYAIHLWTDPLNARALQVMQGHEDEIRTLSFSHDGEYLASAGADAVVRVWEPQAGRMLSGAGRQHRNTISVTGQYLAGSGGNHLQVWQLESGQRIDGFEDCEVQSVATSPDGHWLAVTDHTETMRIWDLTTGQLQRSCTHTRGPIRTPSFGADSRHIATASFSDGLVWLWDLQREEALLVIPEAAESSTLEAVILHPDGKRLICGGIDFLSTAGNDGVVCIWDLEERDKIATLTGGVRDLTLDSSGRLLAGASMKHTIMLWDIDQYTHIRDFGPHPDQVLAIAFSPDGQWLVSGCQDGTVRVWEVATGQLHVARQFDTVPQSFRFGPDNQWLYSGNQNTTAFRIDYKRLLED